MNKNNNVFEDNTLEDEVTPKDGEIIELNSIEKNNFDSNNSLDNSKINTSNDSSEIESNTNKESSVNIKQITTNKINLNITSNNNQNSNNGSDENSLSSNSENKEGTDIITTGKLAKLMGIKNNTPINSSKETLSTNNISKSSNDSKGLFGSKNKNENNGKTEKSLFKSIGLKINKKNEEPSEEDDFKGKMSSQEGFEESMFNFTFNNIDEREHDAQRKAKFGLTLNEMKNDLLVRKIKTAEELRKTVSEELVPHADSDLDLIFSTLLEVFIKFTSDENMSLLNQMIRRIEKIIASDTTFYTKPPEEKSRVINENIFNQLPSSLLTNFNVFLGKEIENPFGLYNDFFNKINAQDFILTGDFINVQYKNGEFFYVDMPSYLIAINSLLIDHLCTIYCYSKSLKFNQKEAALDIEDQKFRLNLEHKSIVSTNCSIIFARKNTMGVAKLINNPNYYKDLLSEFDKTAEEKDRIIEEMVRTADKRNFLVIGPTGSGKTTLLRQLLLDKETREQNLITIEDTKELNLPNAISYLTNKEHTIHDIFVSTLRMNPSRVVVGETRDVTILDILELCLTTKSATTLHATDLQKAITRIRMMSRSANISSGDLDYLIFSAIDMFVFIIDRKITEIYIKKKDARYDGTNILNFYDKLI